jgi:nucleoside-diphosphate-sugar epimerase
MKLLVTGAAGLIGGYVAREMVGRGHTVRGFDLREADVPGVEWSQGDLRDLDVMEAAVDGMDAVCHLAAIPNSRPRSEWPEVVDVNWRGTYIVMEAMARRGVRRVVFASSACVLGGVCNNRYRPKPAYLPFDEGSVVETDEPYSLSKMVNEQTGRMFQLNGLFDTAIAMRFWNVRDAVTHGLGILHVPTVLFAAVHPHDVTQALRLALESDLVGFHAFAVAGKNRYNADGSLETVEQTRKYMEQDGLGGIELRDGFPETYRSSASHRRLTEALGYEPQY